MYIFSLIFYSFHAAIKRKDLYLLLSSLYFEIFCLPALQTGFQSAAITSLYASKNRFLASFFLFIFSYTPPPPRFLLSHKTF